MIIQPEEARLFCVTNDPNVSVAYSYKDLLPSPTTCPLQGNCSCGPCHLFLKPRLTEVISFWNTVSLTEREKRNREPQAGF